MQTQIAVKIIIIIIMDWIVSRRKLIAPSAPRK
jgi:hypothetical protein